MSQVLRGLAPSRLMQGLFCTLASLICSVIVSASEVRSELSINSATEPEPFFNRSAVNGQIRFERTSAISALQVVVQVTGTAAFGDAPTAAGADYFLASLGSDGLTLTPVPAGTFVAGAGVRASYPGFVGTLTFPPNVTAITLVVIPLNDDLIEGAESVVFSVKRDDALTSDDDGNGNATDDYVVADSTSREITITDSDAQLSISATRPRAAEYTQSSGPVAGQPFITAMGEFSLAFEFNPVAVKAPTAPTTYEIKMLRTGSAQNSFEPDPFKTPDYDLSLQANVVGTSFAVSDTTPGAALGATQVVMNSSLPPLTPAPAPVGGPVTVWNNPPFAVNDIVAFQGHPHPYRVIQVVGSLYQTAAATDTAPGVVQLIRPGFIVLERPIMTAALAVGSVFNIGQAIGSSDSDRRIRTIVAAPTGTGPGLPSLVRSIAVSVYNDFLIEGALPAGLSLIGSSDYILRTPQQDIVTLADDESILNVVSVTDAVRGQTDGLFRFTLTQPLPVQSVVSYSISGTADLNTDVTDSAGSKLTNQLIIPVGVTSIDFRIKALTTAVGTKTLTLTVGQSLDYLLQGSGSGGSNPTASIAIYDQATIDALPAATVSVASNAQENGTTGFFQISLSNLQPTDTTVNFSLAGTAVAGTDYVNPGLSVVIPANTRSAQVPIVAIQDALSEGSETILLIIGSGNGYRRSGGNTVSQMSLLDKPNSGGTTQGNDTPVEQQDSSGCGVGGGVGLVLLAVTGLWARLSTRSRYPK